MKTKTPTREEALAHFGVKGMKWGVRKPTAGGTLDRVAFGKKGAADIASRVSSGQSVSKARLVNSGRLAIRALLAIYAALVVRNAVRIGANTAVFSKMASRGKDAIPAIMATAGKLKYAPLKGGAYVITTLK